MRVRRRLVALVSAIAMLAIGALVVLALVRGTQSERGREYFRRALEAQLARGLDGTVHLGKLSGSFVTDLTTDSLEIRGSDDSVFVATGPLRVTFDPRDLIDGRIIIRTAEITRPRFTMRRGFDRRWSHDRLWPGRNAGRDAGRAASAADGASDTTAGRAADAAAARSPRRPRRARSAFGSVFVIEEAFVYDGRFTLMMPWEPADSLRGARRDSAVAVALANKGHLTQRAGADRYIRTWTWSEIDLELPRVRLSYPDSAGRVFEIRRLDVVESNPPFTFRELAGSVRWQGDSVWFDVPRFRLPGSVARGAGKVVWGSDLPIRYDARIEGDTVSLADIAWIDPSLPTEGGGSLRLAIANARGNLDVLEYAITAMDVRTHHSRLRGQMTWGVGGPVTTLRQVDLEATPIDFALIERFHQGPLPFPFSGAFTGRVRARGGPLHRFVVDDLRATYSDRNVDGAVSSATGRGELDILRPAETTFRSFDLDVARLDLRTLQALDADFPRLNGLLSGTARLDSSWLDVRVSDADITHRDTATNGADARGSDAGATRLIGSGRLTTGEERMSYEAVATALPLSFTTLARSYAALPLRGDFSGPLRVQGSLGDLSLVADLVGDAGRLETDLRVDGERPGHRITGRAAATGFDPRTAFDDARAPAGDLNARLALDVAFDSLADLSGEATLAVDRSLLDGVRVFAGNARARFGGGVARLDTAHLESSALVISASGAMGLHAGRDDTLRLRATVDSLGGLRRWLAREGVADDSLAGSLRLDVATNGWLRDYALGAEMRGEGLLWRGNDVVALRASAELDNLPTAPVGLLGLVADTLRTSTVGFTQAIARATLDGSGGAELTAGGTGLRGTLASAAARVARDGDTLRVRMDSLRIGTALSQWRLAQPTMLAAGGGGFTLDSLVMLAGDASVRVGGRAPRAGQLALQARARGVPLADLAEVMQLDGATEGSLDLDATMSGTRAAPVGDLRAELRGGLVRGVRLDTLRFTGRAAADRLALAARLGPAAQPSLVADLTLPLHLGLNGTRTGFVADGPLSGTLRADSLGIGIFEGFTRGTTGYRGLLAMNLAVGGTWARPELDGALRVRDAQLALAALGDVRWRGVQADVRFDGDSIAVDSVTATSVDGGRTGRAAVTGWVKLSDRSNPMLDLSWRSRGFHAFSRPGVADVDISGDLRLDGPWRGATLRGALTADRAIISIPELASKDVIALDPSDRFGLPDTLTIEDRRLPKGPQTLLENLTIANVPITMGRDVWLRSSEANVNLGGFVTITQSRITRGRNAGDLQLALDGPLQTVRGTYRLNLGPVQRSFEVQQGEIRFYGDPDLNPTLDITALHTVRQYSQQGARPDVRVRVHIGGTLLEPTAELSTPDSARVTNADLVSYLVTGGPSYEITGGQGDYASTAARVLVSSAGNYLGGKVSTDLCDDVLVSTAGADVSGGRIQDVGGSILSGTRFSCAKQLSDRAFVRLDAGLCQVGQLVTQGSGANPLSLDAFGVKLDYLLAQGYTASVGIEPPTSLVLCSGNASARGFVPTPQQIGLDLFRSWRF